MADGGASAGILLAGSSIAGAVTSASASRAQGNFAKRQSEANARLAEIEAEERISKGEKEAFKYRKKIKQMQGSQKAALAAQGISISDGTAFDILSETAEFGEIDAMTIKNNAYKEAFGLKSQAIDYRTQGKFAKLQAQGESFRTLITGGLQAAAYGIDAFGGGAKSTQSTKPTSAVNYNAGTRHYYSGTGSIA